MKIPNFTNCETAEIVKFAKECTVNQIENSIEKMSPEQVMTLIQSMNDKKKPRTLIIGLSTREHLEAAGSSLTVDQALDLIETCLQIEDKHNWKLSPLLVGMPNSVFSEIIQHIGEEQLQIFKDEGVTEPVQHQLTTLSHKLLADIQKAEETIDQIYKGIQVISIQECTLHNIREIIKEVELCQKLLNSLYVINNQALAISWNTNRLDIIETFNKIKDSCQKFTLYGLGTPSSETEEPTGIYHLLEQKLCEVYGNPLDPEDSEALKDTEPAMEGLVKLSIWYLRDYWELGLLPNIKKQSELDLDLERYSETERVQYREKLFAEAQKNLSHIGLKSVKNIKENFIFSKESLQEYIREKTLSIVK